MDKDQIQKVLNELKQQPKKKFSQSYDLIINLKQIDVKVNPVDAVVALPHSKGKKAKIVAFVEPQFADLAQKSCDLIIKDVDFPKYADKKLVKKLAEDYDYFIAQANLMPKVAATFGRVLGSRGKMPNPKMGCVVPPNINWDALAKKLNSSVKLSAKKATNMQCTVGKEDQPDQEIIDNVLNAYQAVLKQVPNEVQNIKSVLLKLTMSKPVRVI